MSRSSPVRTSEETIVSSLGPLERKVLNEVWRLEKANVRAVTAALESGCAYTTVMTTLDRLYKKGYLDRKRQGRAFIYSPRMTRDKMRLGLLGDVIAELLDSATSGVDPVLASIVDSISDKDRELLDELERLVREKKMELERE